jgi:S-adenosylmethionine uptake transporter
MTFMRRHPHLFPFLVTALALAMFCLMDALMKGASIAIGAYSALLLRSCAGTLLMVPLLMRGRERLRWPPAPVLRLHLVRGLANTGMALAFFYSLVRLPIAEAIALSFIAPLAALYLASLQLGEKVSRQAMAASVLGLAGVAIIAAARFQPGTYDKEAVFGVGAVLVSALLYAWNLVMQRKVAQLASASEITLTQNLVMALALLVFAPWWIVWPDREALEQIIAGAILANCSLMLLSWAYARAEAQVLVPIEYSAFLWAMLYGWLFFGEEVTAATLAGAVCIVIGCWIAAPRKPTEQTSL